MASPTPSEEKDLSVAELFKKLSTTEKGLSSPEAAKRLVQSVAGGREKAVGI